MVVSWTFQRVFSISGVSRETFQAKRIKINWPHRRVVWDSKNLFSYKIRVMEFVYYYWSFPNRSYIWPVRRIRGLRVNAETLGIFRRVPECRHTAGTEAVIEVPLLRARTHTHTLASARAPTLPPLPPSGLFEPTGGGGRESDVCLRSQTLPKIKWRLRVVFLFRKLRSNLPYPVSMSALSPTIRHFAISPWKKWTKQLENCAHDGMEFRSSFTWHMRLIPGFGPFLTYFSCLCCF